MSKDLSVTSIEDAKQKVSDIQVVGDGDTFALLCKASSKEQGWMKSTKVANVEGGCIVQVSTQQRNPDGSYAVAEAVTFVPNVQLDKEAEPRVLVPIYQRCEDPGIFARADADNSYERRLYLEALFQAANAGVDVRKQILEQLESMKPN